MRRIRVLTIRIRVLIIRIRALMTRIKGTDDENTGTDHARLDERRPGRRAFFCADLPAGPAPPTLQRLSLY